MTLLRLIRWFGVRRGVRTWRRGLGTTRPLPHPVGWTPVHGARPNMPGYRRRRRNR